MKRFFVIPIAFVAFILFNCKQEKTVEVNTEEQPSEKMVDKASYKFSLAQWSMNKGIFDGTIDPMNFAADAKGMGFEGLEYVSQLYLGDRVSYPFKDKGLDAILAELKHRSDSLNMQNLIIMIDGEGELSFNDEAMTKTAIENHKKWIDAAAFLGCHSIRVNLFGEEDHELWVKNSIRSLKELVSYAQPKNVSIIVENHGGNSSNGVLLARVMEGVNSKYCGTLPDFGNFCIKREGGARWGTPCVEEYDMYKGIRELMPYAKGVSAKSYAFDESGKETKIDYGKMMQIVAESDFEGFIGVEFEGEAPYKEGIKNTKALLKNEIAELKTN